VLGNLACVATGSLKPMPVPDEVRASFPKKHFYRWKRPLDAGIPRCRGRVYSLTNRHERYQDLSLMSLLTNASVLVQLVMALLLLVSLIHGGSFSARCS